MDICKVTTTKMEVHFIYIYLEHGVILVFFFSDLSGDNPHCHPTLDGIHLAIYSYPSTESE
jgi:hypothetical protein